MAERIELHLSDPRPQSLWRRLLRRPRWHLCVESEAFDRPSARAYVEHLQAEFPWAACAIIGEGWRDYRTPIDGSGGEWTAVLVKRPRQ